MSSARGVHTWLYIWAEVTKGSSYRNSSALSWG